jgi:hypothetical protein
MSEQPLKTLQDFPTSKLNTPAVILNGHHQRMSVSVVASPRNRIQENLEAAGSYVLVDRIPTKEHSDCFLDNHFIRRHIEDRSSDRHDFRPNDEFLD